MKEVRSFVFLTEKTTEGERGVLKSQTRCSIFVT